MSMQLYKRLKSERGASFLFALFVFIVCTMASAIVITAATAAVGQLSRLGKIDQHYHAAVSAAELFQGSVGDSSEFVFTQERTGTQEVVRTETTEGSGNPAVTVTEGPITTQSASVSFSVPAQGKGYQFLPALTYYALVGNMPSGKLSPLMDYDVTGTISGGSASYSGTGATDSLLCGLTGSLSEKPWPESEAEPPELLAPFSRGNWLNTAIPVYESNSDGKKYLSTTYLLSPNLTGFAGSSSSDLAVTVNSRLWDDWTLELEFCSPDIDNEQNYYLYMVLGADVKEDISTGEELGNIISSSTTEVINSKTVTQKSETTITWSVRQIVPGKGLPDVTT